MSDILEGTKKTKFKASYVYMVDYGHIDNDITLDPKEYLFCEDEDDLETTVRDDIYDDVFVGDLEVEDCELDFEMPEDFVKAWKELKGL